MRARRDARVSLRRRKEPPYEAVVESDEAFARCGPGKNFYPTGKLKRGDHVTVRRHDPGGWFMIDPPPGSFSLIRSDDVQREGNVGTVKPLADGQSPVRIGSAIDPDDRLGLPAPIVVRRTGRDPRRGDRSTPGQPRCKCSRSGPPKGEFRWIEGMSLIPVDQQMQDQQIRDQQARRQPSKVQADADPFAAAPQSPKAANASLVALDGSRQSNGRRRPSVRFQAGGRPPRNPN